MCGIFFYKSREHIYGQEKKDIHNRFMRIKHRGPNASQLRYYGTNVAMGFHRLAIVDPTDAGMQPFEDDRFVCMVNGEIYNYRNIIEMLKNAEVLPELKSHSDCEVVLPLFRHIIGNEKPNADHLIKLVSILDGEYAFIIHDTITGDTYFGVDELRVRPLFLGYDKTHIALASEQKSLTYNNTIIIPVPSGAVGIINKDLSYTFYNYYDFDSKRLEAPAIWTKRDASLKLRELLIENVRSKLNPEREFGFLLSGGLDSSLVCGIAANLLKPHRIRTFTVGFDKNASDVVAARLVAKYIDSIHSEFIFSYEDGINILRDVIYSNESWDQTTTRASIPMMLAARAIKRQHPEMAVIYSGEMSDELFMGYFEWANAPSSREARDHVIKRLRDITYFDGLRADRTICSVGCELRLPFFSCAIMNFVLSLPPELLMPQHNNNIEKYLLRSAFDTDKGPLLIPENILWRTKHAFSDATSIVGKTSWKEYLKAYADQQITNSRFNARAQLYFYNTPQTKEDMLYREIFDEFLFESNAIPYKWLPNWAPSELTDASATALSGFKESEVVEGSH
jgi:asparagine synthase (glutamine-hydrolysing)